MRITGGRFRGRQLPRQRGAQVRPTSDRVREALFSILGQDLDGCTVLDVYAGSGVLSLEAVSRGAVSACCYDRDARAVRQLRGLVQDFGVSEFFKVQKGIVPGCLPEEGSFDIVFLDPPYADDASGILSRVAGLLSGVLVLEHSNEAPEVQELERVDQREYGGTKLSFYRGRGAVQLP